MLNSAKLIKIGNSQGLRLPKWMISKYGFGKNIVLEQRPEGILLRTAEENKLSWEDTYKAMAQSEQGDWDGWESVDVGAEAHL